MIDRDQLRETIDRFVDTLPAGSSPYFQAVIQIVEAARLVADPDTLIITKVDGRWPDGGYPAAAKVLTEILKSNGLKERAAEVRAGHLANDIVRAYLDALLEGQPK